MQDKTILITGSTSGIGLEIASRFAKSGAKIVLNGFLTNQLTESSLCEQILKAGAVEVIYDSADLSQPDQIDSMMKRVLERYDGIDILINNAGIQFVSPIETFPPEKWEQIIRIDLIASFYTIRHVVPQMKRKKYGRIINIASAHGLVASPFKSAYVAAKHGLLGLTKSVALEVAEHGITVNAVCPGYVKTPLVMNQISERAKLGNISEEEVIRNVILGAQATKQFVTIEQIGELVEFLCSDSASSITGSSISIDGGWTAA
jgi:3-hydroxybutyrate dehydrogenase